MDPLNDMICMYVCMYVCTKLQGLKMKAFWSLTLHYWVSSCRHFKETWCFHLQCKDLESSTLKMQV